MNSRAPVRHRAADAAGREDRILHDAKVMLEIRVECYAGYRGEETPRRFWMDRRPVDATEILDRWLAPDHRYFKIRGHDGDVYILRHEPRADRWELWMYRRSGCTYELWV